MMDARPLYPDEYHPVRRNYTPDARYKITPLTRADHPVRYYYIDFGLSTHFAPGTSSYVVGDIGRDTDVPELSDDVPYDPFKVDIFSLGNVYFKELDQVCLQHLCALASLMLTSSKEVQERRVPRYPDQHDETGGS